MKTSRKPVVGEKLYAVWIGGRRYSKEEKSIEVEVVKVGRKYFYVSDLWDGGQFDLQDWRQIVEYGSANWKLYENEQAYRDDSELRNIKEQLRRDFGSYYSNKTVDITLDQARRIMAIIEEAKGEE